MKTIKRILLFTLDDLRHILFLIKSMFIGFWKGDWNRVVDAYYWIIVHCSYDSKRIK